MPLTNLAHKGLPAVRYYLNRQGEIRDASVHCIGLRTYNQSRMITLSGSDLNNACLSVGLIVLHKRKKRCYAPGGYLVYSHRFIRIDRKECVLDPSIS